MSLVEPVDILREALPGSPRNRLSRTWRNLPEQPLYYWEAADGIWAVYVPLGGTLSRTAIDSIEQGKSIGLRPLVVVRDKDELLGAARYHTDLHAWILCEVAGAWRLIPPLKKSPCRKTARTKYATRVSVRLLRALLKGGGLPSYFLRALRPLLNGYDKLVGRTRDNDAEEMKLLRMFACKMLRAMGFCSADDDALQMLDVVDRAGWGGRRDHFFHSFQNLFLGAKALAKIPAAFANCQDISGLGWRVDPIAVWTLVALYHDVGYGTQTLSRALSSLAPVEDPEESANGIKREFLKSDHGKQALRHIGSLAVRLMQASKARSTWTPPTPTTRRTPAEKKTELALRENFMRQHGVSGAFKLHHLFMPKVDLMGGQKRDVLRQTVLMACVSMPYHEWEFRRSLRLSYGDFAIPTDVMPYAAVLAFVDSIQDDRRELERVDTWVRFLEELQISRPSKVTAKLNMWALNEEDVLWKRIEGLDVLSHLDQSEDRLNFEYPEWILG